MAIEAHNLMDVFAVLTPDLRAQCVAKTPTLYEELDADFGGFAGHSLVAIHEFDSDWQTWERHPAGDEIVTLLSGAGTLVLRTSNGDESVSLNQAGAYVVIPRNVWHTARVSEPTQMLFITPGEGTENEESPSID